MSNDLTKRWAPKLAVEADDYRGLDWKVELDEGETIEEAAYTPPEDSTLTIDDVTISGTKTIATGIAGGVAGETVEILATITTSAPRTLGCNVELPIV